MHFTTHQTSAVNTEGRLEVGGFVEVVFEALSEGVTVGSVEVGLHLSLADHPIPASNGNQLSELSPQVEGKGNYFVWSKHMNSGS